LAEECTHYGRKSSDRDISIVGNALSAIAALSGKTKDDL